MSEGASAGTRHVLHVFSTFAAAGPQLRTVELAAALGSSWRHSIVACDGRYEAFERFAPTVDARRVELPNRTGWFGGLSAARTLLAEESPDLLCTYNWGSYDALLAARLAGRRTHLHHEDGFNADEASGQKRRRMLARRLALGRVYGLVVPSRGLEAIAARDWRVDPARVHRIANGVHTERFGPENREDGSSGAPLRAALGIAQDALVVGSVGHLRPVKRFDRLIEACHALPESLASSGVHLVLIGDGVERTRLEALALTAPPPGGQVHFVGHQTELAPWYDALDVYALSSDSEQHPISLVEAMASELPVAGTDVGDVRATLPEAGRGLVVPLVPEAAGALSSALETLLTDPRRRATLAALGRERAVAHFSHGEMVSAYRRLYEQAASA